VNSNLFALLTTLFLPFPEIAFFIENLYVRVAFDSVNILNLIVCTLSVDIACLYCRCTTNGEVPHKVLFQTRNLMRTALSPDQSKLIMSTSSGYIMVVHDFDINTIADDLKGFKVSW